MNYYNDFDKGAAAWLRELIKAGLIPNGYVDERSITDVTPSDVEGFTQCHFFAGIGGWSYALQLAGIPANTRLWTGSPPCQPFSVAGKQLGQLDERHLAPTFMRLVDQCRPPVLFGEQVAAAIGKHWLDDLFTELERQGYACGASVLPAASVGAPHRRDRLFFGAVAHSSDSQRKQQQNQQCAGIQLAYITEKECRNGLSTNSAGLCSVADTDDSRPQGRGGMPERADQQPVGASGVAGGMADASSQRRQQDSRGAPANEAAHGGAGRNRGESDGDNLTAGNVEVHPADSHNVFWSDADWLGCRDGKFRPVESGSFPLAHGIPSRVGRLRGYGNAIVPQVAAEFIKAFTGACTDAGN